MSRRILIAALSLAPAAAAPASAQVCTRAGDERTIEVLTPGAVGAACDLRYVRDGGKNISVPYHADNSATFCAERAAALVKSLTDTGFSCIDAATVAAAAAPAQAPAPVASAPIETPPGTRAAVQGAPAVQAAQTAPPAIPAPITAPPAPSPSVAAPAPSASAGAAPATNVSAAAATQPPASPAATATTKLAQPPAAPARASVPATAGPTALAPQTAAATTRGPNVRAVGRVVGAAPEPTAPVQIASAQTKQAGGMPRLRPSEDIIRGVLAAQAASWNDGDLEAFMSGYWNDPNLKLVSGTDVSKGWAAAMKRYRDRYGAGDKMGRLSFDALDVRMLTDDVAVAVGRFRLEREGAPQTGTFTLVMQRFDGLWRIVHDHSTGDAKEASSE